MKLLLQHLVTLRHCTKPFPSHYNLQPQKVIPAIHPSECLIQVFHVTEGSGIITWLCLIWLSSWFHMFRQWCGHTSLSNTLDKWSNNKLQASVTFLEKPSCIVRYTFWLAVVTSLLTFSTPEGERILHCVDFHFSPHILLHDYKLRVFLVPFIQYRIEG